MQHGSVRIPYGLQVEDLTQLAGAGHTSGGDALAMFVNRGWIVVDDQGVTILDVAALRECAAMADEAPELQTVAS